MSDASGQPRSAALPTCTSARAPATPRTRCAGSQPSSRVTSSISAPARASSPGLLSPGHRVTAVEPLPEMLDQLRSAVPEATALEGGAEAIPLPAESADVVTVAQAFHWFDHGPALVEIARVLRPGGRVALVWNVRDERQPYVRELTDAMVGRTGVDEGRSSRSTRAGCSGRSSMPPSASSRKSTAGPSASSSSPAATARFAPKRSGRRYCRPSTTCSRNTPVTEC